MLSYERDASKRPENLIYNWVPLKILWDSVTAAMNLKRLRVFNKCSFARNKLFPYFLKGKDLLRSEPLRSSHKDTLNADNFNRLDPCKYFSQREIFSNFSFS